MVREGSGWGAHESKAEDTRRRRLGTEVRIENVCIKCIESRGGRSARVNPWACLAAPTPP